MAQGTFHIITFGCQMNVNDSFWLARSLQRRGFVESPLEKAEVVILNTCAVREHALGARQTGTKSLCRAWAHQI